MLYRIYSLILLIFFLSACSNTETTVLRIQPVFDDDQEPIAFCSDKNKLAISVQQLQFFLSEFTLNGKPLQLAEGANGTQNNDVVLIGGDCSSSQWQVHLPKLYSNDELEFSLSVPFEVNHQNPLTQTPPLNLPEMFWSWQQGHKFLRLDAQKAGVNWSFHIGSIGCQSPSVMRAPTQACARANRYRYKVTLGENPTLLFNIGQLLANVDFSTHQECMGDPNHVGCEVVMTNLEKTLFKAKR
jgi:uncharacterized repeat protein (TIGR04052 family)